MPPSEKFTLFHLLPISIYFMAKNTHGLGTCSKLTGFITQEKPHLAVSFLDTVMIFHYIHGLPATEILPCRVQSISHRESLVANLTACVWCKADQILPQGASALWFQLSKSPFTPHHHFTSLGTPTVPHRHGTLYLKIKVRDYLKYWYLQRIDGTAHHGMLTMCWGHTK